jgi:hypothetical protein
MMCATATAFWCMYAYICRWTSALMCTAMQQAVHALRAVQSLVWHSSVTCVQQ